MEEHSKSIPVWVLNSYNLVPSLKIQPTRFYALYLTPDIIFFSYLNLSKWSTPPSISLFAVCETIFISYSHLLYHSTQFSLYMPPTEFFLPPRHGILSYTWSLITPFPKPLKERKKYYLGGTWIGAYHVLANNLTVL